MKLLTNTKKAQKASLKKLAFLLCKVSPGYFRDLACESAGRMGSLPPHHRTFLFLFSQTLDNNKPNMIK